MPFSDYNLNWKKNIKWSQGLANLQPFHMKISMQLVFITVTNHSRVSYYIKSNDLTYQSDPFHIT